MSISIRVTVEDVSTRISTYNVIGLERSTAPAGTYAEITTLPLVAGTYYYDYLDTAGDENKWYKYRFKNTTLLTASLYSNPFQPQGNTRKRLRQKAMNEYKAGLVFNALTGSTSTVQTTDSRVITSLYSVASNRGKGSWLTPVVSSLAYQTRRITGSDGANGAFTVNPIWSGSPANGDEFEWSWSVDFEDWNLAVNRALGRYSFMEIVPLVGTGLSQSLTFLPWLKSTRQVYGLWYTPTGSPVEVPWTGWWEIKQDQEGLVLQTSPVFQSTTTLYMKALRWADPLFTDDSLAPLIVDLDYAAALIYDEVLAELSRPAFGTATIDLNIYRGMRRDHQLKLRGLRKRLAQQIPVQTPQLPTPPVVSRAWSAR